MATKAIPQKSSGKFLGFLPNLGKLKRLLLLVLLFVAIFVPLTLLQGGEKSQTAGLQSEISTYQKALSVIPIPPVVVQPPYQPPVKIDQSAALQQQADLQKQIDEIQINIKNLSKDFYITSANLGIIDNLMAIAKLTDVEITQLGSTAGKKTINVEEQGIGYRTFQYTITMSGDIPRFHNFMLALDKISMLQISGVSITTAKTTLDKDTATIDIDIFVGRSQ
jgi:hypothetical protein